MSGNANASQARTEGSSTKLAHTQRPISIRLVAKCMLEMINDE